MVVKLNNCQTLSNQPKKQAIWMLEWPNIKCLVEWFPIRNKITSATLWEEPQTSLSKISPPRSSYVWCIFNQILEIEIHPMTFTTRHLRLWKIMFLLKTQDVHSHKDSIASTNLLNGCKQLYFGDYFMGTMETTHQPWGLVKLSQIFRKPEMNHCIGNKSIGRYIVKAYHKHP